MVDDGIKSSKTMVNFFNQLLWLHLLRNAGKTFKIGKHDRYIFVAAGAGLAFGFELFGCFGG